ncbi:MAG: VOC family protein [Alicyclobacillus sp.]|nr:VOC family protein [Alicyclobacillus sp.]
MTTLKPYVAITVRNLDRSLVFYRNPFGLEPVRVRPGYAKFDVDQPPLNFTLNEHPYGDAGALNHLGLQVGSTEDVFAAKQRLEAAGLATFDEMNTTCCYALQDKIWVTDPDGNRWEVFVVLDQEGDRKGYDANRVQPSARAVCCTRAGSTSSCCAS